MERNKLPGGIAPSDDCSGRRLLATRMFSAVSPEDGSDKFDVWAQHLAYLARPSLIAEADRSRFGFSVEYVICRDMNISTTVTANPQRFVRSQQTIKRTGVSNVLIQVIEQGGLQGLYDKRAVVAEAGDVVMVDLARPFDIRVAASTIMCLMLPRDRLPPEIRACDLHGTVLRPGHTATNLLAMHLRRLAGLAATLTVAEGVLCAEAAICLAQGAIGRAGNIENDIAAATDLKLIERVQIYIDENLNDVDLSADKIAFAMKLSRSTLYRLFRRMGGVAAHICERRLRRGYEIIAQDLCPDEGLGVIGLNQGFRSEAHFSRLFTKRFGTSPSAARKAAKDRRRRGVSTPGLRNVMGMPPLSISGKTSRGK